MLDLDRLLVGMKEQCQPDQPDQPDNGKYKSGRENIDRTTVDPTNPTNPTEKQRHAETQPERAARPLSLEPLPGRYFIDPVEHGYLASAKTMTALSECKGYPTACPRCRLLMDDERTCLLGPEGGDA